MSKQELNAKHTLLTLAKGGILGLAVTLVAALVAAVAMTALPSGAVAIGAVIACLAGGAAAAIYVTRKLGVLALWFGLASGLVVFVLLYLLGALVFWRIAPASNSLPIFLSTLCGGVGGALLRNAKPKRKRR